MSLPAGLILRHSREPARKHKMLQSSKDIRRGEWTIYIVIGLIAYAAMGDHLLGALGNLAVREAAQDIGDYKWALLIPALGLLVYPRGVLPVIVAAVVLAVVVFMLIAGSAVLGDSFDAQTLLQSGEQHSPRWVAHWLTTYLAKGA